MDLAGWMSASGDEGSSVSTPAFADPDRDLASYHASVGGAPTEQGFIDAALQQSRWSWDERFTAEAVNAYISEGF